MARTWPVTRRKQAMIATFDAVARPIVRLFSGRRKVTTNAVRTILVVELWHMGDVVLATPVLLSLRAMYPEAEITVLGKDHARELLESSGLADNVITFDFPWTAASGKYELARYDRNAISRVMKELRSMQFDLVLDCRMDLRSNTLTRATGAKRRIGYDFGGGGFLLTDALPAPPPGQHKVDDWMALLDPLAATAPGIRPHTPDPLLRVTEGERGGARELLGSYGVTQNDRVVGIHPGASHEGKRWSTDGFAEAARRLAQREGVRIVVFVDPSGYGTDMQAGKDAIFVRTSIREMMALLSHCDVLICNDSGPMHIAAALGVPVVAVFIAGDPGAYGPRGLNHLVIGRGGSADSADVSVDDVVEGVESALGSARDRVAE